MKRRHIRMQTEQRCHAGSPLVPKPSVDVTSQMGQIRPTVDRGSQKNFTEQQCQAVTLQALPTKERKPKHTLGQSCLKLMILQVALVGTKFQV